MSSLTFHLTCPCVTRGASSESGFDYDNAISYLSISESVFDYDNAISYLSISESGFDYDTAISYLSISSVFAPDFWTTEADWDVTAWDVSLPF